MNKYKPLIDSSYDFIIEMYERIDQSEIYRLVNTKLKSRNQSWYSVFSKPNNSNKDIMYQSYYYDLNAMKKNAKFKSQAPSLQIWIYNFINDYPDLISLNEIRKYAIKEVSIEGKSSLKNFEELNERLKDFEDGNDAVLNTTNDIINELHKIFDEKFTEKDLKVLGQNWVRPRLQENRRLFEIKADQSILDNKIRGNIINLQKLIDKTIDLEYFDENNVKKKEFYKNNSERLEGYFDAVDLFRQIVNKKIDISYRKEVAQWGFKYEIEKINNKPILRLDVQIVEYNFISFGKTKYKKPHNVRSYNKAKSEFVENIYSDMKALLEIMSNQGQIKIIQDKSRKSTT